MLSFPFLAIQFCDSSAVSVTEITKAMANFFAFSESAFALQLGAILVTMQVSSCIRPPSLQIISQFVIRYFRPEKKEERIWAFKYVKLKHVRSGSLKLLLLRD
jgi:hypothetical protein